MDICHHGELYFPGIGHYKLCSLLFGPKDAGGHKGMGRGGIGTDDKDAVCLFQFGNGIGHGSTSKGCGKTCHSRGVSETGAVIHAVCAHPGPGKFLHQIVFLIGDLGRGQKGNAVASVNLFYLPELRSGVVQCLIPGYFSERTVFAQQGPGKPLFVLNELVYVPALDAKFSLVNRTGLGGNCAYDLTVQHLQIKTTSASAVGAGSEHGFVIHYHSSGAWPIIFKGDF